MSAEYTPGPWRLYEKTRIKNMSGAGEWVTDLDFDTSAQDARLIVAAPALLESLKELLSWSDFDENADTCLCRQYVRSSAEGEPGCMHTRAAAAVSLAESGR